jgi:hypothetical protein
MQGTTNSSWLPASEDPSQLPGQLLSWCAIPFCKFLLSRLLLAALVSCLRLWHRAFLDFLWFAQGWDFDKPGHWTRLSNQDLFFCLPWWRSAIKKWSLLMERHHNFVVNYLRYYFDTYLFSPNFQIKQYINVIIDLFGVSMWYAAHSQKLDFFSLLGGTAVIMPTFTTLEVDTLFLKAGIMKLIVQSDSHLASIYHLSERSLPHIFNIHSSSMHGQFAINSAQGLQLCDHQNSFNSVKSCLIAWCKWSSWIPVNCISFTYMPKNQDLLIWL